MEYWEFFVEDVCSGLLEFEYVVYIFEKFEKKIFVYDEDEKELDYIVYKFIRNSVYVYFEKGVVFVRILYF